MKSGNQDTTVSMRGRRAGFKKPIFPEDAYRAFIQNGGNMNKSHAEYCEKHGKVSSTLFTNIFRAYILNNPAVCKEEMNDMFRKNYQYNAVFSDEQWERYLLSCIRSMVLYYYGNDKRHDSAFMKEHMYDIGNKAGLGDVCKKYMEQ